MITKRSIRSADGSLHRNYEVEKNDTIREQGYEFIINEVDGHHVVYIEVKKLNEQLAEAAEEGAS
ncbi:CBS domain containing-hemolysin-like protein [Bacillus pumilus]|nr:CBS domain containing-hemolysin-like protein [Bacillus pumilus]